MLISKDELATILKSNICEVSFVKKDGSIRNMVCTLISDLLPPTLGNGTYNKDYLLCVYDIEAANWRNINFTHGVELKEKRA